MGKMRLKWNRASCPKLHSQDLTLIELKPRTCHSRAHLFSRTSLCLAEQKGPFLLHNPTTLQARCSTSSLSDEESHDQCPELVFLGYMYFVGSPLHPLSAVSRHGRELARVPPPSEGNTKTSLASGIRNRMVLWTLAALSWSKQDENKL